MKKKLLLVLALALLFSLGNSTAAFSTTNTFDEIWTVAESTKNAGGSAICNSFELGETPWLYVQLPFRAGIWKSQVTTDWFFNESLKGENDTNKINGMSWCYINLTNWPAAQQPGDWTIDAAFTYFNNAGTTVLSQGYGSTTFKVNGPVAPEPVSSALFLIGSGAMIAFKKRKKMKKVNLMVIGFIVFSMLSAGSAFAIPVQESHMTTDQGVTTYQPGTPATYDWDQKPWFFFNLPTAGLTYSVSWWKYSDSPVVTPNLEITSGQTQIWHGLDNWFDIRQAGNWTVRTDYTYAAGSASTGPVNFRVNAVPEPISSALFLIGGTVLAVRQYRKKRKA